MRTPHGFDGWYSPKHFGDTHITNDQFERRMQFIKERKKFREGKKESEGYRN